jgi:hypothetical protein
MAQDRVPFSEVARCFFSDHKVACDKVTFRANGDVEVRHSYFYRHGRTAEGFAAKVRAAFPDHEVQSNDEWRAWPGTSYFVAIMIGAADEIKAAVRAYRPQFMAVHADENPLTGERISQALHQEH